MRKPIVRDKHYILSRVMVDPITNCWVWQKARLSFGYGVAGITGKRIMSAHRLAWSIFVGPIPAGRHVCHKCDNPPCCNPEHLFLGTHADNMKDASVKGRVQSVQGEQKVLAKLRDSDIPDILASTLSHKAVAEKYGIDPSQISRIRSGNGWKKIHANLPRPQKRGTKLTANEARAIFVAKGTYREIGATFGINSSNVCLIKTRRLWAKHTADL